MKAFDTSCVHLQPLISPPQLLSYDNTFAKTIYYNHETLEAKEIF